MLNSIIQRVERATHVLPENLIDKPPFPPSVKIEITNRCNYKCCYCAVSTSPRTRGVMDFNFFKRIVLELKDNGADEIGLFLLGESFLVNSLPKYIRYCKKVGIPYVFITTNGSLCTPERMKKVINAGLDCIKFSVNAGTRGKYKEMCGVDMFDTVVENIKWVHTYKTINRIKINTAVSSIFIPERESELAEFRQMIENYVDDYYLMPPYNQGGQIQGFSGDIIGNPGKLDTMVPPIPCWVLFNAVKITWDGKLTACPFDHEGKLELADLNKVSIKDAWNDANFIDLRRQHLNNNIGNPSCRACLKITK